MIARKDPLLGNPKSIESLIRSLSFRSRAAAPKQHDTMSTREVPPFSDQQPLDDGVEGLDFVFAADGTRTTVCQNCSGA